MNQIKRLCCCAFPVLAAFAIPTLAQNVSTSVDAKLAILEASSKAAQSAGDNAFMLICAALVLMMTGPDSLCSTAGSSVRRTC